MIIGRPNVGKSTLVNALLKERRAIIDDAPGVTRDIIGYILNTPRGNIELRDSGGILLDKAKGAIQKEINNRVLNAVNEIDLIMFVVDAKEGIHPDDTPIVELIRKHVHKTLVVANKVETMTSHDNLYEFYKYGVGEPISISAKQRIGLKFLVEELARLCELKGAPDEAELDTCRLAIVGRPNVGKSSMVNALLNETRVLVDDSPGTTRDAIEIPLNFKGQPFSIIDTAGLRKRARVKERIEYFSTVRSTKSIETADIVVVVLDASELLLDQDKKILNLVFRKYQNMVIFINKWDLIDRTDEARDQLIERLHKTIPETVHYPIIVGSVHLRHHLIKVLEQSKETYLNTKKRVPTSDLNQFVETMIRQFPPVSKSGEFIKFYYAVQVDNDPPVLIFFVKNPKLISKGYQRHLEKKLRHYYPWFIGRTLTLKFRHHRGEK